jgi:hypothetical protein
MDLCDSCCIAKSHKIPFALSSTTASNPLEVVHSDVWGPSPVISHTGFRYYVLFTDQYSRYSWIYFCSHKSEVPSLFEQFKTLAENLLSTTVKTMQIDGGTEFKHIINAHPEIQFHISCPYTPQQNGLVERKHRQVVELTLASMFHVSIPTHYWPEVFESVVFTINRIPSAAVSFSTPYNILFHKTSDFNFFKVLGCLCYPYTRPYAPNKLSPKSHPCVLIGYSNVYKGYKCLDLTTNKIYLSRHVVFDENYFPFKHLSTHTSLSSSPINPSTAAPLVVLQQSLPTTSISTDSFLPEHLSLNLPHLPNFLFYQHLLFPTTLLCLHLLLKYINVNNFIQLFLHLILLSQLLNQVIIC